MDVAWSRVSMEQPSKVSLPWPFIITPRHHHKACTSLPGPSVSSCKLASGLSQPHLVSVECAYQSYSRGMRSNSLVPWWLRQLGQACDVSSTRGLTQDFNVLSSGNFYQIQNPSPHAPTLPDSSSFSASVLLYFLIGLLANIEHELSLWSLLTVIIAHSLVQLGTLVQLSKRTCIPGKQHGVRKRSSVLDRPNFEPSFLRREFE